MSPLPPSPLPLPLPPTLPPPPLPSSGPAGVATAAVAAAFDAATAAGAADAAVAAVAAVAATVTAAVATSVAAATDAAAPTTATLSPPLDAEDAYACREADAEAGACVVCCVCRGEGGRGFASSPNSEHLPFLPVFRAARDHFRTTMRYQDRESWHTE